MGSFSLQNWHFTLSHYGYVKMTCASVGEGNKATVTKSVTEWEILVILRNAFPCNAKSTAREDLFKISCLVSFALW